MTASGSDAPTMARVLEYLDRRPSDTIVGVPEQGNNTPRRTIRIADQLWDQAQAAADANGENVSDVIRRALERYVKRNTKG